MKRNKQGISLITLVITIIIMIILAAAIVLSLTNSGFFDKANDATSKYNLQQVQKIAELAWAEAYADGARDANKLQEAVDKALVDNKLNDKYEAIADEKGVTVQEIAPATKVADINNQCVDENTTVFDEFGNKIVIPAGFKIRVDDDAGVKGDEKTTATNATQGIVIEDCTETVTQGSQFVWVPVGKIYTDTAKTESLAKTITLGRYSNFVPDENGVYTPAQTAENYATATKIAQLNYTEDTDENHISEYDKNVIARNIGDFVTSATQNKGYYIGRFEAGNLDGTLVCKAEQTVYAYNDMSHEPSYTINQKIASTLSQNMYNDGEDGYKSNTFSSDLINSYAWDTAVIFIQTFEEEASSYYDENNSTGYTTTGGNQDEYCNINDMSGNAFEYDTESCESILGTYVLRGGCWNVHYDESTYGTGTRIDDTSMLEGSHRGFRPILYVAITE